MNKNIKIKQNALKMSLGKANGILRKKLLFLLVKKCKLNVCFRCGKKINKIKELSIDHKKDWLYSKNPINLFFDLKNISFSHLLCNIGMRANAKVQGNSKSGFKGVHHRSDSPTNPWRSVIDEGGKKRIYLGYFKTPKEAAINYDAEIIKRFGEKAITNKSLNLL